MEKRKSSASDEANRKSESNQNRQRTMTAEKGGKSVFEFDIRRIVLVPSARPPTLIGGRTKRAREGKASFPSQRQSEPKRRAHPPGDPVRAWTEDSIRTISAGTFL